MFCRAEMHGFQRTAEERIIETPNVLAAVDMGLGKTVITLSAIDRLVRDMFKVTRVLVAAPKRVAETGWAVEASKWSHLRHLRIAHLDARYFALADTKVKPSREGLPADAPDPEMQRQRKFADAPASRRALWQAATTHDICTVSYDFLPYLVALLENNWPWDMFVPDESVFLKSTDSLRFRSAKHAIATKRVSHVVELSGRPRPNGLKDLWAQAYLLDKGARLGDTQGKFQQRYFVPTSYIQVRGGRKVGTGHVPRQGADAEVMALLADVMFSMRAKDWLDMPEVVPRTIEVELPEQAREQYDRLKRDAVLFLQGGEVVRAEKTGIKMLQIANGAVYDSDGKAHWLHDAKLDAIEEVIEAGNAVLLAYAYKPELAALKTRLGKRLCTISEADRWKSGQCSVLAMHPQEGAYGLDWMQHVAATTLWFGPTYNRDHWDQLNARLARQGQQAQHVVANVIVTRGTLDAHVLRVCEDKGIEQDVLLHAMRASVGGAYERSGG